MARYSRGKFAGTGTETMLKASANVMLPTSIIGSLPRPSWYTAVLGNKSFLEAMVNSRYREQYEDAVLCFVRAQEVAGLDIVTDGDCRFDQDVGGQSWTSYPPHHMEGFDATHPKLAAVGAGGIAFPRGHILHDYRGISGNMLTDMLRHQARPEIITAAGRRADHNTNSFSCEII